MVSSTDNSGLYSILTDVVGDTIKPVLPSSFLSSSPPYAITSGTSQTNDFGLYILPDIADLSVDITNVNIFRPGFQTQINLSILNKGSLTQSAIAQLTLDSSLQFFSAVPSPFSVSGNTLEWSATTLNFMENQNIIIAVKTSISNVPGDSIHCFAQVNPKLNDVNLSDNFSQLNEMVTGSFDPNDKNCVQGSYFTDAQIKSGKELEFIIRFQNTGNYQADFVNIIDTLNSFLDYNTFRIISYSHSMDWSISGSGVINFNFDQINLLPSTQDEPKSHGYVKYSIKCKNNLSIGNAITNTAYIYFDFNAPVNTNTTTTTISYPSFVTMIESVKNTTQINSILISPNPVSDKLNHYCPTKM